MTRPYNTLLTPCIVGFVLLLQSCASAPEQRPKAVTDAEYFLQQGTAAFYNDEYPLATQHFSRALAIYQSIDDSRGNMTSRLNLIESTIALGHLDSAEQQLHNLELLSISEPAMQRKLTLLKVRLLGAQSKYPSAISALTPLLPPFDGPQQARKMDQNDMIPLSIMARLAFLSNREDSAVWVQRFENALHDYDDKNNRFRALLLRLQASQKQHEKRYSESKNLLQQALEINQANTNRRAIAGCLQQMAELESEQQHWQSANTYLQRALNIQLWISNQTRVAEVLQQLIAVNQQLGDTDNVRQYSEQLDKISSHQLP